jgi:drug/metabolite transporter (DMT)-like permease
MSPQPKNVMLRAGFYMIITTACFVAGDTCLKLIGTSLPLGEVIALIGAFSTIFLSVICALQGIFKDVPLIFTRSVALRSSMDMLGSFMFVAALIHMPFANLSAIMQSVPLCVVVFAVVFLGEKAGIERIGAVIAGFIGVLMVVKPSLQTFSIYELLALSTVAVVAVRDLVTKNIPATVPLMVIALGNAVFVTISGFFYGLVQGFQSVSGWQIALLLIAGLLITVGYILIVLTVRLGELSATAPFRYAEVIFAIIAGIVVFNEYPDLLSYFGMALIISAGIYAARYEAVRSRKAAAELMPSAF